jgi:hypothetical protein
MTPLLTVAGLVALNLIGSSLTGFAVERASQTKNAQVEKIVLAIQFMALAVFASATRNYGLPLLPLPKPFVLIAGPLIFIGTFYINTSIALGQPNLIERIIDQFGAIQ